MKLNRIVPVITLLLVGSSAFAENWAQWRGPNFNGSSDEKGLPAKWTKESARWTADLPGASASTPIIYGDRVFLSTADDETRTMHAMCLDRKTGKVLWNNKAADGMARDDKSNYSSPSPVATTDRVFFFYGNGALAAFDPAGKQLWARNITKDYGNFAFQWTFSASPLFYGGKLYLQILQRDVPVNGRGRGGNSGGGGEVKPIESFLLALDPADGKTLWRQVRPSQAVQESHEAYTTPMPFEFKGRKELIIAGGDCLTGSDPETGAELWRWGTWNQRKIGHWRLVPSPVAGGGVVLACAPKGEPVYAVKAGASGTVPEEQIAWKSDQKREVSSDVPTPAFYDGDFFVLSDVRKHLSRIEPATGNEKWTVELPGRAKFEASPTAADGKIYLMNFAGEVTVVDAVKGEILGTMLMGEENDDMTRSAIAVANGELFIRTNHKLFCIGKK